MLFGLYDTDGSGAIDYKEFTAIVFGGSQQAPSQKAGAGGNDPESLARKLQEKLASRGARGIIGLQRQFKIMDDDNSKSLNKYEF